MKRLALILLANWLLIEPASADPICDFENVCYSDSEGHLHRQDDTMSVAVQPPSPTRSSGRICRFVTIQQTPQLPPSIVELCTIGPEEQGIRDNSILEGQVIHEKSVIKWAQDRIKILLTARTSLDNQIKDLQKKVDASRETIENLRRSMYAN